MAGGADAANRAATPDGLPANAFTGPVWKRSLTDGSTRDGGGPQNPSSARGEPAGGFMGDMDMIGCLLPPSPSACHRFLSYAFETSKIRKRLIA